MQGIYVDYARPKSKKQVIQAVKENPSSVTLEATSLFGNEYDGPIKGMPENTPVYVVGPDPHTKRDFYLTIVRNNDTFKVT
jgi:hypothetical protein